MSLSMKLAFIIDPIDRLDPTHDSTVAMMEAADSRGDEVWITEARHLTVIAGQAWAKLDRVSFVPVTLGTDRWVAERDWFKRGETIFQPLETMNAVFMRTDPPVNTAYLYATYILDYVDPAKTLVLNKPSGIRAANEKMYALQFQDAIPDTIVTQDKQVIRKFLDEHGTVVMKPLGGKAGEGILFLQKDDRNFNSMVEISTLQGQWPIMVQTYLPAAKQGDKRIIMLDGEPVGTVNRVPTGDDFRGNMAVGGRAEASEITPREREICDQVGPVLRRDGLIFVGIDVIGGYLTEVNVTSPTGIREADRLSGLTGAQTIGNRVMRWVESNCPKISGKG
jgi:glutathione synthase